MSNLVDENPSPSSSYDDENGAVSSAPRPLSPPSPPTSSAPSPSTAFFPTKAVPTRSKPTLHKRYSLVMSTEDNHAADDMVFLGDYREVRSILDYTYHRNYTPERQRLQDNIIRDMLDQSKIVDVHGQICTTPTQPWVVFTAGAMGAGKSWVIKQMMNAEVFPLLAFVSVDPDVIRRYLPEFESYVEQDPMMAGEMTRKEAGFIAEVITEVALREGKNVLVDGSLRDHEWYTVYFDRLRRDYPMLKTAILHVVAEEKTVLERARKRGEQTGRHVPEDILRAALEQVPRSVEILSPLVDYSCCFGNEGDGDVRLVKIKGERVGLASGQGLSLVNRHNDPVGSAVWQSFKDNWLQTCKWVPKSKREIKQLAREEEREEENLL
ncbi:hypothetical protein TrST_g11356 [Triparma strigata]|uniref:Zeta toxin domain-containing protein n=1 Tax=Triparma strigata TaxID=1606541 RepID=A0A9W7ETM4_9STRA|nr:hypothetical protein TrST_g11356 [Triparma strigata]